MSKYIYTTIYEQFTGLKPPEPKSSKPRRRRGFGHPYRMRLNMHEDGVETVDNEDDHCHEQNEMDYSDRQPNSVFQSAEIKPQPTIFEDIHPHTSPKVTYKKRRQYSQPLNGSSIVNDSFEIPDY